MIELLVGLLLLCIVIYAVYVVLDLLKLPPPIRTLAYLIIAVIVILWLLDRFGLYTLR